MKYALVDPRKYLAENGSLIIRNVTQNDKGAYRCEYGSSKKYCYTILVVNDASIPSINISGGVMGLDKEISSFPDHTENVESLSSNQIEELVTVPATYSSSKQIISGVNKTIKIKKGDNVNNLKIEKEAERSNQAQEKWLVIFSVLLTIFVSIIFAIFVLLFIEMFRDRKSKIGNFQNISLVNKS